MASATNLDVMNAPTPTALRPAPGTSADASADCSPMSADLAEFAFTANGPWVVVESEMPRFLLLNLTLRERRGAL